MRIQKKLLISICFALACLYGSLSPMTLFARTYLDIDSPNIKRIPIAIPDFKNQSNLDPSLGSNMAILLNKDLDFTGYFKIIDPKGFLGQPEDQGMVDFKAWSLTGADLLVNGSSRMEGGQLHLEMRLYDILQGRQLLGKEYISSPGDYKKAIHRFADEILFLLTGEHGLFQTRISYLSSGSGQKEIYMADFDGSNFKRLTQFNSITLTPRWSPKGNELAFNSYKDGTSALYLLSFPGLQSRKLSARPGANMTPAWFPDGESLAMALNHKGNSEIYQISRTGEVLRRLSQSWGIDVSPSWSPDGKQLAFVSNRSGSPQIYILNVESKEIRRLTFQGTYNVTPVWSPKGNLIAYAGMNGGNFQIYSISPAGGDPQCLTTSGKNESPDFSPDGRMIIFSSTRQGKSALFVMNVNGANQRRITYMAGEQSSPSWCSRKFDD